jgi:apoptosis-inducing factor 1
MIRLLLGRSVTSIDVESQVLDLDDGRKVKYEKVLLATGGSPKVLKWVKKLPEELRSKFSTFRTIEDLKKLNELVKQGKRIVVFGGGFLGSELSCAIARYGKQFGSSVTQV